VLLAVDGVAHIFVDHDLAEHGVLQQVDEVQAVRKHQEPRVLGPLPIL
jgi:hypothetical protein